MKKIIWTILIFIFFLTPFIASAEEVKYGNIITDQTTVDSDFKVLGLDINDWYEPTKYDYDKWYVIAMSEAYVDTVDYDIQTYFYLYNPMRYSSSDFSKMSAFTLEYKLNNSSSKAETTRLIYDEEHLIYKVKGFTYSFIEKASVEVNKISYYNYSTHTSYECNSTFTSTNNHSKLNGFEVELSFNSMLVLEEYKVVPVEIPQDDNFANWWNTLDFGLTPNTMHVYFYNFNFPEHIKYDEVTYAKFEYDIVKYKSWDKYDDEEDFYIDDYCVELDREENIIKECKPKNNIFQVNKKSIELSFPTFYLGNRIQDKQFGDLDLSKHVDKFEYDCSVLLDATYGKTIYAKGEQLSDFFKEIGVHKEYSQMEEIEILELHYKNDGVTYKCQVAGGNLSPGDPGYEPPIGGEDNDKSLIDKIIEAIKEWFRSIWDKIVTAFKNVFEKYKVPILIIASIIAALLLLFILKNIVVILKFLWTCICGIGYLICLPFTLIYKAITKNKESKE